MTESRLHFYYTHSFSVFVHTYPFAWLYFSINQIMWFKSSFLNDILWFSKFSNVCDKQTPIPWLVIICFYCKICMRIFFYCVWIFCCACVLNNIEQYACNKWVKPSYEKLFVFFFFCLLVLLIVTYINQAKKNSERIITRRQTLD